MEKTSRSKSSIFAFLPKTAQFSFSNPPFSPSSDRRTENLSKLKTHQGKGFSGPIISIIPVEARRKTKNGSFDEQEPTSPKVSCIGQIKHKKKMCKAKCSIPSPKPERKPDKKASFKISRILRGSGGATKPGRKSAEIEPLPNMPTVSVKWQKELFPAVEIDTNQPPLVFKCQLYDLTGVPPERQKIMVKGGLLKDDADWSTIGVKEGQRLMMMGTAEEIVKAPEKGPVFMEDLPEEEQAVAVGHSAGLFNLGNTCYMNSTLQCLHSVPELKSALLNYTDSGRSNELDHSSHLLTVATRDVFGELDRNVKPVAPMHFWMILRKKYPQFSQQHNGFFMQQDAEECWTQLMYTLSQSLKSPDSRENPETVKSLFGIELVSRVHCAESGEESTETESVYSLKCHISQEVNHLHEGLKHGLKSELEKVSPSLQRSAIYLKESRINALPRYLTIQFVRFFWKRESNQKAKILRKVEYPLELDVFDLCSDELRVKLQDPRKILRDEESAKLGLKTKDKNAASKDNDVKMLEAEGSSDGNGEASKVTPEEGTSSEKQLQLTGIYDLVAVLTHKGRSADSGHYVAWVKQENGKWVQFDDDHPIPQREEDITKLSGGGDWHMAYICMYKARGVYI